MPKPKDSFGVQAAKFSLYAPALAFVLGIFLMSQPSDGTADKSMAQVKVAIGFFNMAIIGIGLLLGIVALASIRKFGTAGILVRAIVGVAVNGLLVLCMVGLFVPAMMVGHTRERVVGHWRGPVATPNQQLDMTFATDGTFTLASAPMVFPEMSAAGHWTFARDKVIGLAIDRVDTGNPKIAGQQMLLGQVRTVDDGQLVLITNHGDERYTRQ